MEIAQIINNEYPILQEIHADIDCIKHSYKMIVFRTYRHAHVLSNELEVLKYFYRDMCLSDKWVCVYAVEDGKLECLKSGLKDICL